MDMESEFTRCSVRMFEEVELYDPRARAVICYPPSTLCDFDSRIDELKNLGVVKLISYGSVVLGDMRVVGKGHAAVIVLARMSNGDVVAVKIRRLDSKRQSLEDEGRLLSIAYETGYAPKVYGYSRNYVIREYIDGPTLGRFLVSTRDRRNIVKALVSLLQGARALDIVGIELDEISNPSDQVVLYQGDPEKPMFIDFETGRIRKPSSNVTSVLGFIVGRSVQGRRVRDLAGLGNDDIAKLRELARLYKQTSCEEVREQIFNEIIGVLLSKA